MNNKEEQKNESNLCPGCKYNNGLFCTAWECPYKEKKND